MGYTNIGDTMKRYMILFSLLSILWLGCDKKEYLENVCGKTVEEVKQYAQEHHIPIKIKEEYHDTILKDIVITQSPQAGLELKQVQTLTITVSKGKKIDTYKKYGVNELGNIPIMMYHGIVNEPAHYIGGNIDKEGYQRTAQAFLSDLEFYYQEGYRMIRLIDNIEGNINVPLGYSPLVLTFDDGLSNNIKIIGKEDDDSLIIDPMCAVGILETFKKKYPDYGVTATFFLNSGLFMQENYNQEIIDWLIEHGYDIGNHSYNHIDFTTLTPEQSTIEIGKMYSLLEEYTDKYVPIVALPFGSPYQITHPNFPTIIESTYNEKKYKTKATLRVGWESNVSCFHKEFNPLFLKRIRAYDNNGLDFDITMNFEQLKKNRYISDGDIKTVVAPNTLSNLVGKTNKKVILYE